MTKKKKAATKETRALVPMAQMFQELIDEQTNVRGMLVELNYEISKLDKALETIVRQVSEVMKRCVK